MNTIQIKIQSELKQEIERFIEATTVLDVVVDVVDLKEQDLDYLYEQSTLYVQDGNIHLSRSILYYQTPFLLPKSFAYNAKNLVGAILYLTGQYEQSIPYFTDCYLSSIAKLTFEYQNKGTVSGQLLRNLIDSIVEDDVYYSNMAVSQHYADTNKENLNKLRYLYEQALKYVSDYKDELHLLKYYMLLYTQYDLFDDAKTILRHSLTVNEPLASNFKSMLDTAYLSHIQEKKSHLSFYDVPYYFGNSFSSK